MQGEYVIMDWDGKPCPQCGMALQFLADDSPKCLDQPAFLLCFVCEHVEQIGAGTVRRKAYRRLPGEPR